MLNVVSVICRDIETIVERSTYTIIDNISINSIIYLILQIAHIISTISSSIDQ